MLCMVVSYRRLRLRALGLRCCVLRKGLRFIERLLLMLRV